MSKQPTPVQGYDTQIKKPVAPKSKKKPALTKKTKSGSDDKKNIPLPAR